MQTALHILSLVDEIRQQLVGGRIVSTEFYKKERAAYFFVKGAKSRMALGFVYHPHGTGVFCVPASKVKIDTREKPWPIFDLDGAVIESVAQLGLDRLFKVTVKAGTQEAVVLFEALGANGNVLLLDPDGNIHGTLRKRDFEKGAPYVSPPPFEGIDPIEITAADLSGLIENNPTTRLGILLGKNLIGFNKTMTNEVIERADIDDSDHDDADLEKVASVVRDLAGRFRAPDTGYLHRVKGKAEVYPFKLKVAADPPEKFKTLSLAVLNMSELRQTEVEQADEEKTVTQAVGRAIKRLERRIKKVEQDIVEAADYERYKKLGELLKINFDSIRRGMESITVTDIYTDSQPEITIPLDPALSPAENAEVYFRKHRKGREGLDLMERRLEISKQELEGLQEMRDDLEANFDSAKERYRAELESLLPKEGGKEEAAPRLPFREYTLSSGLTIFVGRDGSDNDRTTFEYAKPYEIWLHTQQCPGSHVVMKHPNKSFEPSKQEIAEAAAIAAWYSKARNDSLVPVVYTERRYVRKPRKAKPGLVTVEREKSIMVTPTKPES